MTEQIFNRVKSFMNSQSFLVNDSWLSECIEYFCSENSSQKNVNNIQQFVKEQFLLSDLREINSDSGCLPPNLSEIPKTTLDSKYTLQLLKLYDISVSKYKQLDKIRNVSTANIEATNENQSQAWEPTGKRMLQLFLTDGIQEILAIEYKPIRILNDSLLPGLKLLIMGPVICRRGVILLEETNVAIRDGEVADLLVPNALENVLANALNLPINEDPYNDTKKTETGSTIPKDLEDYFDVDFDEIERSAQSAQPERGNNANKNSHQLSNVSKNSSTLNDNNLTRNSHPKPPAPKNQIINEICDFPDDDDMIFDDLEMDEGFSSNKSTKDRNLLKTPSVVSHFSEPIPSTSSSKQLEFPDDDFNFDFNSEPKPSTSRSKQIEFPDDDFNLDDFDFDSGLTLSEPVQPLKNNEIATNSGKATANFREEQMDNILQEVVTGTKRSSDQLSPIQSTRKIPCPQNEPPKNVSNRKITDFIGNKTTKRDECPPKVCDFISELSTLSLSDRPIQRSVRAKVTLIGKLTKKDMQWILNGTIVDQSGNLDVDFSSQFMENILGLSVVEFSNMKKNMKKKKDSQLEETLRKKMLEGQTKLGELHCLMELELKKGAKPVVLSSSELSEAQKNDHNKRFKFLQSQNKL